MSTPEPFMPPKNPPYAAEKDDELLPSPGFITDFVASLRGVETPTLFCIWAALWGLSAVSCRRVSMNWLPEKPLYPNLYVFLVAPPARCHKSTSSDFILNILTSISNKFDLGTIEDNTLKFLSDFNLATSKTTPDSVYELLKPVKQSISGIDGVKMCEKGSQLTLNISELATFLNKKKFNVGLTDTLTDLFDCKERDIINTIARGTLKLEKVFVTMIGSTTPDGLKESLPYEVFGEGFMSRTIVVYKDKTVRRFPKPVVFEGFPTVGTIRDRLVWIMRNKFGIYTMTKDAEDWYNTWYNSWRDGLDDDEHYNDRAAEFRLDVNLLRVSMLISMSRYDTDLIITKQDILEAHCLLKGTYTTSVIATQEAGLAITEYTAHYSKVREYIRKKGSVDKLKLVRNFSSKGFRLPEVREIMDQLIEEDIVRVLVNNKVVEAFEWTKEETYEYVDPEAK